MAISKKPCVRRSELRGEAIRETPWVTDSTNPISPWASRCGNQRRRPCDGPDDAGRDVQIVTRGDRDSSRQRAVRDRPAEVQTENADSVRGTVSQFPPWVLTRCRNDTESIESMKMTADTRAPGFITIRPSSAAVLRQIHVPGPGAIQGASSVVECAAGYSEPSRRSRRARRSPHPWVATHRSVATRRRRSPRRGPRRHRSRRVGEARTARERCGGWPPLSRTTHLGRGFAL